MVKTKYITIDTNTTKTLHCVQQILQHLTTQSLTKQGLEEKTGKQGNHKHPIKPYKLGQSIFIVHHQINLTSVVSLVVGDNCGEVVTDIVMMDDGRLVMCLPYQHLLLICNTDGSQVDSMDVQNKPWCITAVNNSTVAITRCDSICIEMYDINNKLKLKSIPVPGMWSWNGITTINNKLVVGDGNILVIIDQMVQTIQTDCQPDWLHGSGDKIFYFDNYINNINNKLYWYSYTDDKHHTLKLPSPPKRMTTLRDGSFYVVCKDGSIQHVSSDGKQYKTLQTNLSCDVIQYNFTQRKLIITHNGLVKVFNEL
ncbi:uncharacterized protein [Mytilus edulis]|uniref:uncharacterized protein isoform X2 n=1 Tax=Mytilus edulis TaxID=6550 RepID=UPI0039F073E4